MDIASHRASQSIDAVVTAAAWRASPCAMWVVVVVVVVQQSGCLLAAHYNYYSGCLSSLE